LGCYRLRFFIESIYKTLLSDVKTDEFIYLFIIPHVVGKHFITVLCKKNLMDEVGGGPEDGKPSEWTRASQDSCMSRLVQGFPSENDVMRIGRVALSVSNDAPIQETRTERRGVAGHPLGGHLHQMPLV